jgi:cation transport regulator
MKGTTMPYKDISELRDSVREKLPKHAQEIYKDAFNNAWKEYKDPDKRRGDQSREQTAHRVAWSAVENEYEKGSDGKWHRKE